MKSSNRVVLAWKPAIRKILNQMLILGAQFWLLQAVKRSKRVDFAWKRIIDKISNNVSILGA